MLEIDSSAGFSGSAALSCSGAPPLGTCVVSTTPVTTPPAVPDQPRQSGAVPGGRQLHSSGFLDDRTSRPTAVARREAVSVYCGNLDRGCNDMGIPVVHAQNAARRKVCAGGHVAAGACGCFGRVRWWRRWTAGRPSARDSPRHLLDEHHRHSYGLWTTKRDTDDPVERDDSVETAAARIL